MFKFYRKTLIALIILTTLPLSNANAQKEVEAVKTHSPYTLYGIGDLYHQGGLRNKAMGGVNYGVRDRMGINSLNPAGLSVQDSLVVMLDFAMGARSTYSQTRKTKTSANAFYFDFVDFSLKAGKNLTVNVGLSPISDIGYDTESTEKDPNIINTMGDVKYKYDGEGGINHVHWGAGYKISKHFSVGANMHYYFGSINRNHSILFNTNSTFNDIFTISKTRISKIGFTFGAQFHKEFGNNNLLTIGAIYQPKTVLPSQKEITTISGKGSMQADTMHTKASKLNDVFMPRTYGIGFSIKKGERLFFGADYTQQDWTGLNPDGASKSFPFFAGKSHSFNAGFEFTPNNDNIKNNLKRWNYRAGFRYVQTFMNFRQENIKEYGISLGLGIPVARRLGSKFNVGIELGQRGTLNNGLIKENFVTFSLGLNIFDLWFHKFQYN